MKITALKQQARNKDRVNVFVDGRYRLSLTIAQVTDLELKVNRELDKNSIDLLVVESDFGKTYIRALEYCLMRPRSTKEVSEYLRRKAIDSDISIRVIDMLKSKGFLSDENFARFWVEGRMLKKGISKRRLVMELKQKGISQNVIEQSLGSSEREELAEIDKMIARKRSKYDDKKLLAYLVRQGFSYSDAKERLDFYSENSDVSV